MRLTEEQKKMVLEAAKRRVEDGKLVRLGDRWVVIGRGETCRWAGAVVADVDDRGRVWWSDQYEAPLRRDLLAALGAG